MGGGALHHRLGSPHLDDLRAQRTREAQPRPGEVCSAWRRWCQRFPGQLLLRSPAPYAESIAPSQHGSTYAHYYEDEEDGWGMPNFYDTYGKNSKMARSNGSLYNAGMYGPQYAPQGELYDRLGRHAYQPRPEDKSAGDTTSESEDDRRGSQ